MTSVTPWSVKGIAPRAREVAKDLARRSGMTLGEWLSRVILDDEGPEDATSEEQITQRTARSYLTPRSPDELARVLAAVDTLQQRLEAAETRTAGAVSGLEQSVREVVSRLETGERDHVAVSARFEGALEELNAGQGKLAERLRKYETDGSGPRSAEALRSLEQALGKVAHHLYDGETRTREMLGGVEARMARLEAGGDPALGDAITNRLNERLAEADARSTGAIDSLRASFAALDGRLQAVETSLPSLGDQVAERVSERLAEAEAKTSGALESLRASFQALDGRLNMMDGADPAAAELRLSDLAASLTSRVEAARAEIAERLWTSSDERFDQMERRLAELAQQVSDAEERSAQAIEDMGNEVLSIADTLNRRVETSEQRAAEAIEQAGGEMARIATAMEARLGRTETMQAEALQRLGEQISGVTDRLGDRIASAERRSAEAMDDVGEKLDRATNRLNQHQERTSEDLAERILLSEERTVRRLEDVLEREEAPPEPAPPVRSSFSPFAIAGFDDLDPREPAPAEPGFEPASLAAFPAEAAAESQAAFDDEPFDATEGYDPTVAPASRAPAAESAGLGLDATYLPEPQPEPEFPTPGADESRAHGYETDDAFEAALFGGPETRVDDTRAGEDETTPFAAETEFVEDQAAYASPVAKGRSEANVSYEDVLFVDDAEPDYEPQRTAAASETDDGFEDVLFVEEAEGAGTAPSAERLHNELDMPTPGGERPLTTRELIEQARAAARASTAAAAEKGRKGAPKALAGGLFSGFGVPGRKKRSTGTVQTALLVAGGAAFLSVGAAGLVVMGANPGGESPERVAENAGSTQEISQTENEALAAPRAAVAMAPRITGGVLPTAGEPQPDLGAAYDTAVQALEANDPSGVTLLRNAANLGHAPAQLYLATLYESGRSGVTKNLGEARRWTERAAQAGDRKAMHNLALYAFEGVGGQARDPALAAQWFRRAADLGLVDSQYNLGRLYEQGLGVSQNMAEAYKWYLIAGRSGDGEAGASAQRIAGAISPDAQAVAQRAAVGFRTAAAAPSAGAAGQPGVMIAQRALSRLGYYQGPRDGVASPALTMAVAAYQREQNLPSTGALDDATVSKLVVFTR